MKSRVRHAKHAKGTPVQRAVSPRARNVAHCTAFCARARSGTDFVAGAALSQGQVIDRWIDRSNGKRETKTETKVAGAALFARSSTDFVAGAALSQSQVHISWQAQRFREAKYRFRGRRSLKQGPPYRKSLSLASKRSVPHLSPVRVAPPTTPN